MSIPQPLQIWPNNDQIISAYYQLSADELTKKTVEKKQGTISNTGALVVQTGKFTGRSPKDRYLVKDNMTSERVWWGDINIPFSPHDFNPLYKKILASLTNKTFYARDVFAGADKRYRIGIRIFNETPWANLFVRNMFIQPDEKELKNFFTTGSYSTFPVFRPFQKLTTQDGLTLPLSTFPKKSSLLVVVDILGKSKSLFFQY